MASGVEPAPPTSPRLKLGLKCGAAKALGATTTSSSTFSSSSASFSAAAAAAATAAAAAAPAGGPSRAQMTMLQDKVAVVIKNHHLEELNPPITARTLAKFKGVRWQCITQVPAPAPAPAAAAATQSSSQRKAPTMSELP